MQNVWFVLAVLSVARHSTCDSSKCVYVCVSQEEEFRSCPRLDIIQPLPESCEEISSDALTVRNFQENECRDYRLGNGRSDGGKLKSFTALNGQPQAVSLGIPWYP